MAAALEFLRLHHDVPLITIDIGANDVNACVTPGATIPQIVACLTPVFPAMAKNLTVTLKTLRAADPHATIIGMNYYIPELAAWLTGSAGQTFAKASLLLGVQFNKLLASVYGAAKAQVADVFTAFSSADMKDMVNVPPFGKLPKDVAVICGWTWMCAPKPFGPNIHANKAGYHAIALAFLAKIRHVRDPF